MYQTAIFSRCETCSGKSTVEPQHAPLDLYTPYHAWGVLLDEEEMPRPEKCPDCKGALVVRDAVEEQARRKAAMAALRGFGQNLQRLWMQRAQPCCKRLEGWQPLPMPIACSAHHFAR
ncbi:MAG: hypothetical protein M3P51_06710 [Chloroflexota bacterium]|nr:hypothetical protein [Chloroflexota bacterium]